jgi:hypothetical protein
MPGEQPFRRLALPSCPDAADDALQQEPDGDGRAERCGEGVAVVEHLVEVVAELGADREHLFRTRTLGVFQGLLPAAHDGKDKSPGIPAKKGFSGLFSGGLLAKLRERCSRGPAQLPE